VGFGKKQKIFIGEVVKMSNECKDWFEETANEAWDCVSRIAEIYDDYHEYSEEVYEKIGQILREYGFID